MAVRSRSIRPALGLVVAAIVALLPLVTSPAAAFGGPQLAMGVAPSVGDAWHTVQLTKLYTDIVVVAVAEYDTATTPLVTGVRNAPVATR